MAREAEERAIWEKLAAESESKTAQIAARLADLQAAAEQAPKAESLDLIQRGEEASTKIDLDEASTRALIDQQLRDSGWEADTKMLRYASGVRPLKGRNLAIAEWPTASGPADYALFAGLTLVGVSDEPASVLLERIRAESEGRRDRTRRRTARPHSGEGTGRSKYFLSHR
jgi:type I restriction enzyme, R subunit